MCEVMTFFSYRLTTSALSAFQRRFSSVLCKFSHIHHVVLHRYKSTYDQYSGVTTLTIYNLREEDEGEYTCKAINSLGEASTSATLLSQGELQSTVLFFIIFFLFYFDINF